MGCAGCVLAVVIGMDAKVDELRALRKRAGLTQEQAAALIHAGLRTYHRYESGERQIPSAEWELLNIKLQKLQTD